VMDSYDIMPDVYSYEGPFGVGYAIVKFQIGQVNPLRRILEKRTRNKNEKEDPYVALARKALETYVKEQKVLEVPDGLPVKMLNKKAGTFVSIKTDGQLRGCIGTMAPVRENIANEIINNAISSGTQDPRFYPVTPDELDRLVYSVDVLTEPEPISSIEELDPFRYGVVVRSGYRTGVLLPNLYGIETPEEQVEIALEKAGIRKSDKYSMERFEVVRHK
ncbi:MAG: AmmeMemoRadiSam system protein A, partial [Clostridiaceae bacterium]|nr:AmmeMemoRadiSam system protein A [Clostridiaceae bacterium]